MTVQILKMTYANDLNKLGLGAHEDWETLIGPRQLFADGREDFLVISLAHNFFIALMTFSFIRTFLSTFPLLPASLFVENFNMAPD